MFLRSSFKSRHRILDEHDIFSHILVVRIVMCVLKDENKRKRGRGWPIKKTNSSLGQQHLPSLRGYSSLSFSFNLSFLNGSTPVYFLFLFVPFMQHFTENTDCFI